MTERFIGVLSGTSLDAVDVALVEFQNEKPHLIATTSYPIDDDLKYQCLRVTQSDLTHCSIDEFGQLDARLGDVFASAVQALLDETSFRAPDIRAIGSHGQTLRHCPDLQPAFTLQIGDPNRIAHRTHITTIADFRRRDIAAGGQGAPLAPAFHNAVFRSTSENRVILNIGGLSNLSILPADLNEPIQGFDTGPGNCLLDSWIQKHSNLPFDKNGALAKQGQIHKELLTKCLSDPFFAKAPPKSTGRELFHMDWVEKHLSSLTTTLPIEDVQATLTALTVESIASAIERHAPNTNSLYVCGGGAFNPVLMQNLAQRLSSIPLHTTESLGIPPNWVEAVLFAWLAKQTLAGQANHCPHITGASEKTILGGIFQA